MSDDDDMVEHESGEAGSSLWYPGEAGQVKKSGHILMKGDKPCKVIDIKVSKTGKHGHGKCRFTAIDIFDGSKHEVRFGFKRLLRQGSGWPSLTASSGGAVEEAGWADRYAAGRRVDGGRPLGMRVSSTVVCVAKPTYHASLATCSQDIIPSTHTAHLPFVNRAEYTVIGIEDGYLQMMTDDGDMKEDLQLPTYPEGLDDDLEKAIQAAEDEGKQVVVSVISAMDKEAVTSFKTVEV